MIISYSRGHKIIYKNNEWIYEDSKELISRERPCIKCGCMPVNGMDACLGKIINAIAACCGHGIDDGYIKNE